MIAGNVSRKIHHAAVPYFIYLCAMMVNLFAQSVPSVALAPNVFNLVVGETQTIQALGPNGKPVKGLTWLSSDRSFVSLSSDDPPVLSAIAPGHVTIHAGDASAEVTVSSEALPLGTVLWSHPGNGSGAYSIVPAIQACFPPYSPRETIDVTDYGFRPDGWIDPYTDPVTGQPCRTHGLKSKAVVKRFACQ